MAFFHANIAQMQRQTDSLRTKSQRMRSYSEELQACIQKLKRMEGLETQIAALQKVKRRTEEEYSALLALTRGLENIIRLYQENERKCENDSVRSFLLGEKTVSVNISLMLSTGVLSLWSPKSFWYEPYSWREDLPSLQQSLPNTLGLNVQTMPAQDDMRKLVTIASCRTGSEG